MSATDGIINQEARVLAAECTFYAAQLAYDMCAAQFDIASKALSQARTDLLTEQQALRSVTAETVGEPE